MTVFRAAFNVVSVFRTIKKRRASRIALDYSVVVLIERNTPILPLFRQSELKNAPF